VGDLVGRIKNDWQKYNRWMKFPEDPPEPLGMIVAAGLSYVTQTWQVLQFDGTLIDISENYLEVIQATEL